MLFVVQFPQGPPANGAKAPPYATPNRHSVAQAFAIARALVFEANPAQF